MHCGWKEKEKGEARGNVRTAIVTISDGWTDRQANRMCIAECARTLPDCVSVCARAGGSVRMSVCISVFADLCLLRLTVLFVCAHPCVPICAVQISHCRGTAL